MKINARVWGFLLVVVVAIVVGKWAGGLGGTQIPVTEESRDLNPKTAQVPLRVGETEFLAEVRRTEAEQALGLSWRETLGTDEAMVFVYKRPQVVTFWMKGMQFPLDFIWVRDGVVVELTQRVPPPTKMRPEPQVLSPSQQVEMVIEVPAGVVQEQGIKVGDRVELKE